MRASEKEHEKKIDALIAAKHKLEEEGRQREEYISRVQDEYKREKKENDGLKTKIASFPNTPSPQRKGSSDASRHATELERLRADLKKKDDENFAWIQELNRLTIQNEAQKEELDKFGVFEDKKSALEKEIEALEAKREELSQADVASSVASIFSVAPERVDLMEHRDRVFKSSQDGNGGTKQPVVQPKNGGAFVFSAHNDSPYLDFQFADPTEQLADVGDVKPPPARRLSSPFQIPRSSTMHSDGKSSNSAEDKPLSQELGGFENFDSASEGDKFEALMQQNGLLQDQVSKLEKDLKEAKGEDTSGRTLSSKSSDSEIRKLKEFDSGSDGDAVETLTKENAVLQDIITGLEEKLEEAREKNEAERLSSKDDEVNNLQARIYALELERVDLQKKLQRARESCKMMEASVSQAADLRLKLSECEADKERHYAEIDELKFEYAEREAAKSAELEHENARYLEIKENLRKYSQQIVDLKAQIRADSKTKLDFLQQEVTIVSQKKDISLLENEIERVWAVSASSCLRAFGFYIKWWEWCISQIVFFLFLLLTILCMQQRYGDGAGYFEPGTKDGSVVGEWIAHTKWGYRIEQLLGIEYSMAG